MISRENGYRGLRLLLRLNWDLVIFVTMIAITLLGGAWILSLMGYGPTILY